ncbi:MAG TPA: hypothetical protein VHV10_06160 [Ktedonobacteraceae bacterium]|nr:hypothetical protein [Ktedonobacteraceae bacterium]
MKRSFLVCLILSILCFMLAACGSTSSTVTTTAAGSSPQEVKVSIGDFYIRSPVTTLTTGTKYQFVVTNVGAHHHDFLIMHPMKTVTMTMDDVYKQALIYIANIAPNETKTLNFTFDHTAPQDMLEFSCHYAGHYEAGMHQAIVVNAAPGASVSPYPNNAIPLRTTHPCDQPIIVKVINNAFTPASVSLKTRETLTITNTSNGSYTLTTSPDAGISSTTVDPHETEYVVFPNAGTFIISSKQHPEVKATVTVSKTAGTTCGMARVGTVSFDANYGNYSNKRYFFTPIQMTVKVGQAIIISNLSDQDITIISTPDAGLGNIQIAKNQHQELRFIDEGTYTLSCVQFPNQKFVVTVQAISSDDN